MVEILMLIVFLFLGIFLGVVGSIVVENELNRISVSGNAVPVEEAVVVAAEVVKDVVVDAVHEVNEDNGNKDAAGSSDNKNV